MGATEHPREPRGNGRRQRGPPATRDRVECVRAARPRCARPDRRHIERPPALARSPRCVPDRRDRDALRHSGASPVNNTAQVPELIVIVGPIASGKSTIAYELGSRFRAAGRAVAVLDLDDVVDTIGGFAGLTSERFRQAQLVYGDLVGAWLRQRLDVVAYGPFFEPEE